MAKEKVEKKEKPKKKPEKDAKPKKARLPKRPKVWKNHADKTNKRTLPTAQEIAKKLKRTRKIKLWDEMFRVNPTKEGLYLNIFAAYGKYPELIQLWRGAVNTRKKGRVCVRAMYAKHAFLIPKLSKPVKVKKPTTPAGKIASKETPKEVPKKETTPKDEKRQAEKKARAEKKATAIKDSKQDKEVYKTWDFKKYLAQFGPYAAKESLIKYFKDSPDPEGFVERNYSKHLHLHHSVSQGRTWLGKEVLANKKHVPAAVNKAKTLEALQNNEDYGKYMETVTGIKVSELCSLAQSYIVQLVHSGYFASKMLKDKVNKFAGIEVKERGRKAK